MKIKKIVLLVIAASFFFSFPSLASVPYDTGGLTPSEFNTLVGESVDIPKGYEEMISFIPGLMQMTVDLQNRFEIQMKRYEKINPEATQRYRADIGEIMVGVRTIIKHSVALLDPKTISLDKLQMGAESLEVVSETLQNILEAVIAMEGVEIIPPESES